MSIACIFGYSSQLFCFALCGVVVTTILLKMIARKKALKGIA